jgi:hypothetical protein
MKSPRKSLGKLMLWGCAGLAYFNLFSSLDVEPGLQFGLSGVLPMAALIVYFLRQKPIDELPKQQSDRTDPAKSK